MRKTVTNTEKEATATQMEALASMLVKEATALRTGQAGANQPGPRKGLSAALRKKVIARRLKTAIISK